ncbi:MAG: hypothetical protein Fur0010_10540 [Bdellovibrio sp.]
MSYQHEEVAFERFQIEGQKGVTLFVKSCGNKDSKNKVLILHDLLDYHQCYLEFGLHILEDFKHDVEVFWMDCRGHGLSTGTRYSVDNFDDLCNDLVSVANSLFKPDASVTIMGQGLGGLIILRTIQAYLQRFSITLKNIVLSNPILRLKLEPPAIGRQFVGRLAGGLGKVFFPIDFESRIMTHDPIKSEIFVKDPLIGRRITYNFYQEILRITAHVRQEVYYINCPTALLVGKRDQLADAETSILFAKGLSEDKTKVMILEDCGHDLFNDICRDDNLIRLYDWIKETER